MFGKPERPYEVKEVGRGGGCKIQEILPEYKNNFRTRGRGLEYQRAGRCSMRRDDASVEESGAETLNQ